MTAHPKNEGREAAPTTSRLSAYLEGKQALHTTPPTLAQPQNRGTSGPAQSPLRAIRAKCLDCCGGQPSEVRACPVTRCDLYPFRLGKRPQNNRAVLSDDAKAALVARLARSVANSPEKLGGKSRHDGGEVLP